MLQKTGKKFPKWTGVLGGRDTYAQTIAGLLRKEHGDSRHAIKQLMRETDASERTVKHWLSGRHGPGTVHFLRLVVSSPIIRVFVLGLLERPASIPLTGPVDRISLARAREAYAAGEAVGGHSATGARNHDPETVSEHDPINVPDREEINERQRWFLGRVVEGRCGAMEIAATWAVSVKTARRDIAALKAAALICYVGSPRKGRYRRTIR